MGHGVLFARISCAVNRCCGLTVAKVVFCGMAELAFFVFVCLSGADSLSCAPILCTAIALRASCMFVYMFRVMLAMRRLIRFESHPKINWRVRVSPPIKISR